MPKRTWLQVLAIGLMVVISTSDVLAQKRINFRRGASSATVSGNIGGKGYLEYVINGRAGQLMTIEVSSGNGGVICNAGSASGKSFSIEMTGGDHLLSVVNTKGTSTTYTMKVSIH